MSTSFNTAIGDRALSTLILGGSNTAIGNAAMSSGISGTSNVAIGQGAMNIFNGSYNVVIGDASMPTSGGATGNVVIGRQSGNTLFGGVDNIIIGRNADVGSGADSNNIILGTNATSSGNHQFALRSGGILSVTNSGMRGLATLVGGTITVGGISTQIAESLTANTLIYVSVMTAGGTQGFLSVVKNIGSDFVINSSSNTDISTIAYLMIEP